MDIELILYSIKNENLPAVSMLANFHLIQPNEFDFAA